jgi:hypothetical protein
MRPEELQQQINENHKNNFSFAARKLGEEFIRKKMISSKKENEEFFDMVSGYITDYLSYSILSSFDQNVMKNDNEISKDNYEQALIALEAEQYTSESHLLISLTEFIKKIHPDVMEDYAVKFLNCTKIIEKIGCFYMVKKFRQSREG